MYKIKYVFLILIFAFHAVSAENLLASKKNIKDMCNDGWKWKKFYESRI